MNILSCLSLLESISSVQMYIRDVILNFLRVLGRKLVVAIGFMTLWQEQARVGGWNGGSLGRWKRASGSEESHSSILIRQEQRALSRHAVP